MNKFNWLILSVAVAAPAFAAPEAAPAPAATQPAAAKPAVAKPVEQPAVAVKAAAAKRPIGFNSKAQRDAQRNAIKNTPEDTQTYKMEDLVRFTLADGRIKSQWVGQAPANGAPKRIKIQGSNATWVMNRFNAGPNAFFNLTRYDFDAPEDDFWQITFTFQQGVNVTTVYAQGGDANEVMRLYYTQQANNVMLNLTGFDNGRMKQLLMANAPDLTQLRNNQPEEVRKYLAPVLRKITGQMMFQPGPADVYRVFTSIAADPAVVKKIESLLPAMTSFDPEEREKATRSLRAMGPAAALAALRYDTDLLLPEQANRLSDLVWLHSRLFLEDPAKSARDPDFLIDCLEYDDLLIRTTAKEALEGVLTEKVTFDPAAPADKRAIAADALRAKLSKAAAAARAAKPAEPAPAPPQGVNVLPGPQIKIQIGG